MKIPGRRASGFLVIFALFLGIISVSASQSGDLIAVIVNKSNHVTRLSENDIRRIYSNSVLAWPDGEPITIYDLAVQDSVREEFSMKILGKTPEEVAEEWAHLKITNQAKNPPMTLKSQSFIVKRVASNKAAIGYVSYSAAKGNPDVRIVTTLQ